MSRAVACPASAHLPRAEETGDRSSADWGTLVHAWAESGKWPVDSLATRRRQAAIDGSRWSRETLWPKDGLHEVSYALHTKNRIAVRERFATREERDAWCASFDSGWLTGTADYVGDLFGEPWIDDLKTGKGHPVDYAGHLEGRIRAHEGDSWDVWQARMYAVAECLWSKPTGVWVSHTWWARYPADSEPVRIGPRRVDSAEILGLTLPLLEMARTRVEASWDRVDARPGAEQCRWCRAAPNCPAMQTTEDPWETRS